MQCQKNRRSHREAEKHGACGYAGGTCSATALPVKSSTSMAAPPWIRIESAVADEDAARETSSQC